MTREKFEKRITKIKKEIQKHFTISEEDIFEGYRLNQFHFKLEMLPNWIFAIWDVEDIESGCFKSETGLWSFCEHDDLLDKFKLGRCYQDKPFTYISDYINDLRFIYKNEEHAYYQSNHGLEDSEIFDIPSDKVFREFRMYKTRVRRQAVLKEKKHAMMVNQIKLLCNNIPNIYTFSVSFQDMSKAIYRNHGTVTINLIYYKNKRCDDLYLEKVFPQEFIEKHYKGSCVIWSPEVYISDQDTPAEEYEEDLKYVQALNRRNK